MATKVKGFYKGLKFISQIFVVKEREMDIGYPTDVKHVAHIGSDGPHGSAPGWMKEFKPGPDFSMPSLGSIGQKTPNSVATPVWSSHDFEKSIGPKPSCDMLNDLTPIGLPKVPRKQKQRKHRSASSPKCSSSSSRSSRAASKLKAKYTETEAAPNLHLLGQ